MSKKNRRPTTKHAKRGLRKAKGPASNKPDPYAADLNLAQQYEQASNPAAAAATYARILTQRQEHPAANLGMARLLHNDLQHAEAVPHWARAAAGYPNNPGIFFNYAYCLNKIGENKAAIEQYNKGFKIMRAGKLTLSAVELDRIYLNFSLALEGFYPADDVEKKFRAAISKNPQREVAHHALGYRQSLRGQFDEAKKSFRKALQIRPDFALAHRGLAFLKRHTELDQEFQNMRMLYESLPEPSEDKYLLGFALGKGCEDTEHYREAFEYWQRANAMHRQLYPYDVNVELRNGKMLRDVFTDNLLANEANTTAAERTPVFIVSMPRSGSTLVEQILASHSRVYAAGEIETLGQLCMRGVKNLPAGLGELHAEDWRLRADGYLEEAGAAMQEGQTHLVNKLPGNNLWLGAIRLMYPNAKVVYVRREPGDTALSCFKNHFARGLVRYSYDLTDLGRMYRFYEDTMSDWQHRLPGLIHELHYEELTREPETEVRKLLEYLELPYEASCLDFHLADRVTLTASGAQVRETMHTRSVEKWRHFESQLKPFIDARAS